MKVWNEAPGQAENLFGATSRSSEISADIAGRINIGDVIKAQVIERNPFEILLRMLDGTVFKAATENVIDAKQGEMLELVAYEKNGKQVFLKIVSSDAESRAVLPGVEKKIGEALLCALNNTRSEEKGTNDMLRLIENKLGDGSKLPDESASLNSHIKMSLNLPAGAGFTAAELYILKENGKRRKIGKPENALVYLFLDMENLGRIESVVKLSGKNVRVNMKTIELHALENLKKNRLLLYNRLMRKGYKLLEIKFASKKADFEIQPVNAEEKPENMLSKAKINLDLRI